MAMLLHDSRPHWAKQEGAEEEDHNTTTGHQEEGVNQTRENVLVRKGLAPGLLHWYLDATRGHCNGWLAGNNNNNNKNNKLLHGSIHAEKKISTAGRQAGRHQHDARSQQQFLRLHSCFWVVETRSILAVTASNFVGRGGGIGEPYDGAHKEGDIFESNNKASWPSVLVVLVVHSLLGLRQNKY
eukprot:jgi/Psemu1/10276/gm1.10276_g